MTTHYNTPAIVIVENATVDCDPRIIGPFATGEAASDWAFNHLAYGVQWHWLPVEAPEDVAMDATLAAIRDAIQSAETEDRPKGWDSVET